MSNIAQLHPFKDIPGSLRRIADMVESGEIDVENMTVIGLPDVWQIGDCSQESAPQETVLACNYAIHYLMRIMDDVFRE